MWRLLLWRALSVATATVPPPTVPATPAAPHFLNGADSFLRSSSRRVGEAVANVLKVQSSLDDMRQDLSGEYAIWENKKKDLAAERSHLTEEMKKLQTALLGQRSLREEKVRLETSLAEQTSTTMQITKAREGRVAHWTLQQVALRKDIAMLETQLNMSQATKVQQIQNATARVGVVQARNRQLQSDIFTTNQQVFELSNILSNRTIAFKQEHSLLLSEVAVLQTHIHSLQDDVVARAKVQLELQRRWKRLAAQASEVVQQKQELQAARGRCEKELASIDEQIHAAQREMKVATTEFVSCQRLDSEGQVLQGQLNECRAAMR